MHKSTKLVELRLVKVETGMAMNVPMKINQSLLTENNLGVKPHAFLDRNMELNPARFALLQMKALAPPVVYIDAPLSYMAEGQASKFYEGEGTSMSDHCDDPNVIVYCVI